MGVLSASFVSAVILLLLIASGSAVGSRCAGNCTAHGTCHEELARCDCLKGWEGDDCTTKLGGEGLEGEELLKNISKYYGYDTTKLFLKQRWACLNACNGMGNCQSGTCQCNPGYFGADCALSLGADGSPKLLREQGYTPRAKAPHVYIYELPPNMTTWFNSKRVDRPLHLLFWQRLLSSGVRVADASKADWFFIPVRLRTGRDADVMMHALSYIKQTWPWWNQTHGARHFMFHLGDQGTGEMNRGAREASSNITFLTHWGLHENNEIAGWKASHVPGKDVVIPVLVSWHHFKLLGLTYSPHHPRHNHRGEVPVQRAETLFFAGRICGDRGEPNASWPNCGSRGAGYSGQIRQKVFYHHYNRSGFVVTARTDIHTTHHLKTTRFCLAPPGNGHGYRQVLVSLLGCIPVVVGDYIYQPFEPEMDWGMFSVQPTESQIPQLHNLLESIDTAQLNAMQTSLSCAAQHLSYGSIAGGFMGESGKYDAFESILQILRVKNLFPNAAPFEYADLDADFGKFMRCGADVMGADQLSAAVTTTTTSSNTTSSSSLALGAAAAAGAASPGLCSHSKFDTEDVSCERCGLKGLSPSFGHPGGLVCCGQTSLAACPRLWE